MHKEEEEKKKFRQKNQMKMMHGSLETSEQKSSSMFLMLYKKSLSKMQNDLLDEGMQQKIDQEIVRTDCLDIDDTLDDFATENYPILKQLLLRECSNFDRPGIKKLL